MFTGIVQELGQIKAVKPLKAGLAFEISCQMGSLELGESIAVDGVCLTVTQALPQGFAC
ncbi:MAG: riboflavin synthase, partial [Proteobacteria bacterium]|nr:riboflavin synthase [Pseudomonadota bacterium]